MASRTLAENSHVSFQPVQYLSSEDTGAVDGLIRQALAEADAMEKANNEEEPPISTDRTELLWYAFDKYASRTKHISFATEMEYRPLVTTFFRVNELVEYRSSRSTLIAFIPVNLVDPQSFLSMDSVSQYPKRLPYFIDSVTIGPTPHPGLSVDAVGGLFWGRQVDVVIHKSAVPFRDW
jgi:hypothetical protein